MPIELFVLVALLAFLAEYIDSSLGMGYGTTLTPLLLLLGFRPLDVVPIVLLSECITGVVAAAFHHTYQNVSFRRHSLDSKVALVLVLIGIVGAVLAVTLALRLPDLWVRLYIGLLVLGMGVLILLKRTYSDGFSWKRLIAVGFLSSFNKGLTGGGYGPLITTGQIFAGLNPKAAVGITSLAEGLVSFIGVVAYLLLTPEPVWALTAPILLGAITSAPLAALTVQRVHFRHLRLLIGLLAIGIGLLTLARALL
ncbi:sulfite exporter TauE/SafE family protein [Candidatus Acetothermia bacterium]|nr:sulfite exporter TauE/SafE family protein [Candidatus Acetothermia bacterium]MCI2432386.1 sulfite exporter TauE/SafE family protein [Candidatus Acetothermia bacterium]MCI2437230.1 sulfite exporter TauE/SafE family protein [Candidatus Acetothermia bacterium]